MELLIDVKFDGCVKSHLLVVVREGRRESVRSPLPTKSEGRERNAENPHEICCPFLQAQSLSQR